MAPCFSGRNSEIVLFLLFWGYQLRGCVSWLYCVSASAPHPVTSQVGEVPPLYLWFWKIFSASTQVVLRDSCSVSCNFAVSVGGNEFRVFLLCCLGHTLNHILFSVTCFSWLWTFSWQFDNHCHSACWQYSLYFSLHCYFRNNCLLTNYCLSVCHMSFLSSCFLDLLLVFVTLFCLKLIYSFCLDSLLTSELKRKPKSFLSFILSSYKIKNKLISILVEIFAKSDCSFRDKEQGWNLVWGMRNGLTVFFIPLLTHRPEGWKKRTGTELNQLRHGDPRVLHVKVIWSQRNTFAAWYPDNLGLCRVHVRNEALTSNQGPVSVAVTDCIFQRWPKTISP